MNAKDLTLQDVALALSARETIRAAHLDRNTDYATYGAVDNNFDADFARGCEVLRHFHLVVGKRGAGYAPRMNAPNAARFFVLSAGYIAMCEAYQMVAVYPRKTQVDPLARRRKGERA